MGPPLHQDRGWVPALSYPPTMPTPATLHPHPQLLQPRAKMAREKVSWTGLGPRTRQQVAHAWGAKERMNELCSRLGVDVWRQVPGGG